MVHPYTCAGHAPAAGHRKAFGDQRHLAVADGQGQVVRAQGEVAAQEGERGAAGLPETWVGATGKHPAGFPPEGQQAPGVGTLRLCVLSPVRLWRHDHVGHQHEDQERGKERERER